MATSGGIAIALAIFLMIGGPLAALLINQERETAIKAQGLAEKKTNRKHEERRPRPPQRDLAVNPLNTLVERVPTN